MVLYDENRSQEHELVVLAEARSPRFSFPGCEVRDEPHAFECFNFLRELLIGKTVMVTPSAAATPLFAYSSILGELRAVFGVIELIEGEQNDIATILIENGFAFVRNPETNGDRTQALLAAQKKAQNLGLCVWKPGGLVRELEVKYDDAAILQRRVVDGYVSRCDTATSFYFTLLPGLEIIPISIEKARIIQDKAAKARSLVFAHRYLLNRTLRLALKSYTAKGLFVAEIVSGFDYPYLETALKSGAAEVDSECTELAKYQLEAQEKNLGIWADSSTKSSRFLGVVHCVVGSSSLAIFHNKVLKSFRLNGISTHPFDITGRNDMMAFEAREELRKCVGECVEVVPLSDVANVYQNGKSLSVLMCEKGLAVPISSGSFGADMPDDLIIAANKAKCLQIGVHRIAPPEPFDIIDMGTDGACHKIVEEFESLKLAGQQSEGIIEKVLPGPRFLVFIPAHRLLVRLAVFGIEDISIDSPFGYEAIEYCEKTYTQRDCTVVHIAISSSGCILASISVHRDDIIDDIAVDLTSRGYTEVREEALEDMTDGDSHELFAAQALAKRSNLGRWSSPLERHRILSPEEPLPVAVIDVWSVDRIAVQYQTEELVRIKNALLAATSATTTVESVRKRMPVVLWYKGALVRGRVSEIFESASQYRITLLDYAIEIDAGKGELYHMPRSVCEFEPQASIVKLAFVSSVHSAHDVREYVKGLCKGVFVYMHYCRDGDVPEVILSDAPCLPSGSLNVMLISQRYARFVETDVFPKFAQYVNGVSELCL